MRFDESSGATADVRLAEYAQLLKNRQEWDEGAREVSEWLLPSRGVANHMSRPMKRDLTSSRIVSPKGKQAFEVMVSALKEGITPSTRPWLSAAWSDKRFRKIPELNYWLWEAMDIFLSAVRRANFYSLIKNYYAEGGAFGVGSMFVGPGPKKGPFAHELHYRVLTWGEYVIGTNEFGIVDRLYRTLFRNFHQLLSEFGKDNLPPELVKKYEDRDSTLDYWYTVVEGVVPETFMDMPFTRFYILYCPGDHKFDGGLFTPEKAMKSKKTKYPGFLRVEGCHEFCYPTYRYDPIGDDEYSTSPGMDAVQTIKRLQEVVKSNAIAYHKSIRPPLNIPIHMRGQVKTFPDAPNYYIDPNQIIKPVYDTRFDHQSAAVMESQLDKILQEIFYNDVFITASRDPNASPLKATQVNNWNMERFVRIGPTLENMFNQGIVPAMTRSFNIMYRAGKLPPLPDQFAGMKPKIDLELTSILAQMMKALTAAPSTDFLQMVGAVAQYKPDVLDIPNFDSMVYDYADIKGVNPKHLNALTAIQKTRQNRIASQQAEQKRAMAAQENVLGTEADLNRANVAKTMSEAGVNFSEAMGEEVLL